MALSEAGGDRFDDGMSLDADPGTTTVSPAEGFRLAAAHAVRLTAAVPADAWDDPALGQWTVRSLVGHLGRAMSTVVDALTTPATEATVSSAADYYRQVLDRVDPDATQRDPLLPRRRRWRRSAHSQAPNLSGAVRDHRPPGSGARGRRTWRRAGRAVLGTRR